MKPSTNSILNSLRENTMPIHKKLEQGGIATKLYAGTLTMEDYALHMALTYGQVLRFNEILEEFQIDHEINLPVNLALEQLEADIEKLNLEETPEKLELINPDTDEQAIAVLYTWIGSSRGSKMILNYVKKNLPEAPHAYLTEIVENDSWTGFMEFLDSYQANDVAAIGEYGAEVFNSVAKY